jgi:DNA-directed RNA polymerase subunit alpha
MAVLYGKFEMPKKIKIEEPKDRKNFAKFIAEPFERGFGHTLGNALRRIMLTALEAPAIISVRIEGIPHEYSAIEGVVEDMTYIILNLKGAKLRYLPTDEVKHSREMKTITNTLEISDKDIEKAKGEYRVTLKEFVGESELEVMNPEEHIMTVTSPIKKRIDIKVGFGRGYTPAERVEGFERGLNEIILDVPYSPVSLVNYYIEDTRVGRHTDYDRLILEVTTDGRISPKEALTFATQIAKEHFEVFEYIKKMAIAFDKKEEEANKDREELLDKLSLKINEIELSVRSANCLAGANIETIGELVVMPESDMLKFRNFGKKSLTEIKEKLTDMGLNLGMDLSKYGIDEDNIKSVIKKHLEEKLKSGE